MHDYKHAPISVQSDAPPKPVVTAKVRAGHVSVSGGNAAAVMGAITLVRHGEPALSRRVRLDYIGYRDWWARYELGGLLEGQTPPDLLICFARGRQYRYQPA